MADEEVKSEEQQPTPEAPQESEVADQPAEQVQLSGDGEQVQPDQQTGEESKSESPESGEAVQAQEESSVVEGEGGGRKKWPIILALVLVLGLGAVVAGFLTGKGAKQAKIEKREDRVVATPTSEEKDSLTEQYEKLSSSDEVDDIETDLQATSFVGIDAELTDIDQELSAED